jgi:hypothetical protein
MLMGLFLGLIGVTGIVARDIGVTTSAGCVDLHGLLFIKVALLTDDLTFLLLLLLVASVRVCGLLCHNLGLVVIGAILIIIELDLG